MNVSLLVELLNKKMQSNAGNLLSLLKQDDGLAVTLEEVVGQMRFSLNGSNYLIYPVNIRLTVGKLSWFFYYGNRYSPLTVYLPQRVDEMGQEAAQNNMLVQMMKIAIWQTERKEEGVVFTFLRPGDRLPNRNHQVTKPKIQPVSAALQRAPRPSSK
ncbi:MAG: hypothetical protein GC193_05295 [Cryomorphaceae bacterium]|nr:hypothetical protein [Cryomorphaceae bacterium]